MSGTVRSIPFFVLMAALAGCGAGTGDSETGGTEHKDSSTASGLVEVSSIPVLGGATATPDSEGKIVGIVAPETDVESVREPGITPEPEPIVEPEITSEPEPIVEPEIKSEPQITLGPQITPESEHARA